jgi:hypothetical protein
MSPWKKLAMENAGKVNMPPEIASMLTADSSVNVT